ncbi:MAG: D-alanyl-D-alanine carboxypeptidase family protein [Erythrobacter sp.]|uniref:D-alanyl-D-alanine carboxypeptidase family protein n=1 Tax=Erythrobacter sp. TaxID=1042 RepID=UPI00261F9199|nr:D-alanyl-D-alanine carboxypeptidase family protein [Erythrobacter sp.]MDJ0977741.1 D-alanyl-D-alanine carboxypeptidase family protein [Erythrobacter sp.]
MSIRLRALAAIVAGAVLAAPLSAKAPDASPFSVNPDIPVALLVDADTGQVLFERGASRRFVPASVTKVMTLYTAFEMIEDGELDLKQSLTVSPEAWRQWRGKGSTMFLNAGDRVGLPDLLTGIATVSANDASFVLAQGASGSVENWTAQMNAKARAIGMTQSHFATPNGWPDEGRTFTSAGDLATLARALYREHPRSVARFIGRAQFRYGGITQSNRDPMLGEVDGADGLKTGYTNQAGYTYLGSAKRGEQRLIVVIAGSPRSADRAKAARDLIEWGFADFERREIFADGAVVGAARVQNGSHRRVDLVTDRPVAINLPQGAGESLAMTIRYDGPLRAPFPAGAAIATLEITAPGIAPARVPLFAGHSVEKANWLDRIVNAVARWLG